MPRPRKELDPQMRSRICELYSVGFGPKKIHDKYRDIPYNTIRSTINREQQRQNNQSRPRSGRPRQLTEEQRDHLFELSVTDPHLKYSDLLNEVDHAVKKRSLQRLFSEMGRRKWNQQKRPETEANSGPKNASTSPAETGHDALNEAANVNGDKDTS